MTVHATAQPGAAPVTTSERAHGFHAVVDIDPAADRVVKRLRSDVPGGASAAALAEYERLRVFSAALASHPYVRCPTPISVDPPRGTLTMTWCAGRTMSALFADRHALEIDLEHVAEQVAIGLECYVATFDEPHPDVTSANILYDPESRVVSFVDFTPVDVDTNDRSAPIEISLGFLVGVGVYESVRPANWWAHGRRRRELDWIGVVVNHLGARHALRRNLIQRVADERYDLLRGFGHPLRKLWYASLGGWAYRWRSSRLLARVTALGDSDATTQPAVRTRLERPRSIRSSTLEAQPLVSVVMANYNYARFIPSAIESALSQTYANVEVVVVDDGSTDDSAAVLAEIARQDGRVRVHRQENQGQAAAWNLALRHARGTILSFLDPDDLFEPTKIESVVAAFASAPSAVLAYHRWSPSTADGRVIGAPFPRGLETGDLFGVAMARGGLGGNSITSVISVQRAFADEVFPLPVRFKHGFGDGYLQATAQFLGDIVVIPDALTRYRLHGDNDSGSLRPNATGIARQLEGRRLVHAHLRSFVAERFGDDMAARLRIDDDVSYLEHRAALLILTRQALASAASVDGSGDDPASVLRQLPANRRRLVWRCLFALPPNLARTVFQVWWIHAPWKRQARSVARYLGLH